MNSLAVQRKAERRPKKSVGNELGAQNNVVTRLTYPSRAKRVLDAAVTSHA